MGKRGKKERIQDIRETAYEQRVTHINAFSCLPAAVICYPLWIARKWAGEPPGGMNNARGKREGSQGITKDGFKAVPDGEMIMHIEAFHYLPGAQPLFLIWPCQTVRQFRTTARLPGKQHCFGVFSFQWLDRCHIPIDAIHFIWRGLGKMKIQFKLG